VGDGVDRGQPHIENPLSPRKQHAGQLVDDPRVGVLPLRHDGADAHVVEGGDNSRSPERIIGPHVLVRDFRVLGHPSFRIESVGGKASDGRQVRHRRLVEPRTDVESKRQEGQQRRAPRQRVFPSGLRGVGETRGTAQQRSEVDDVVLEEAAATLAMPQHQRIECTRIIVIEPRGEHATAAQFAPVFVQVDVVRIIGTGAVVLEASHVILIRKPLGRHTDAAIGPPGRVLHNVIQIASGKGPPAIGVPDGRLRINLKPRRIDLGQVDVHRVVAKCVVKGRADHLGTAGHLGMRRRIHLQLVHRARGVGPVNGPKARMKAAVLAAHDRPPGAKRHWAIRACDQGLQWQVPSADAIGEPTRVGHLVERVDVDSVYRPAVTR